MLAGTAGAQYFDLVQEQVADAAAASHLVAHDMLTSIMHHIKLHVSLLIQAEYGCSLSVLGAVTSNKEQGKDARAIDMHARYVCIGCA